MAAMLQSFLVVATLSLPVHLLGEVKNWKSSFIEKPLAMGNGVVRATAGMGLAKMMLVAPVGAGRPWVVVDAAGKLVALTPIMGNVPAGLSEAYVAWGEFTPLGTKFHRLRLADMREEVVSSDTVGTVDLVVAGDVIFTLHKDTFGWRVGRVKAGRFERIASLDENNTALALGECAEEQVMVVDAPGARFNLLRGPDYRNQGFVAMQSEIVEEAKKRKSGGVTFGGTKAYVFNVFAHVQTKEGQGFVIAKGEKGVGQYFVEFDEQGKEVRRNLLRYPEGDSKKSGSFFFRRFRGNAEVMEATGSGGETAIYRMEGGGAVN